MWLNVHSVYTLMQSVCTIDSLIELAKKHELSTLALTDTNGMYGLIPFFKKAKEAGIKPILGALIDDPNNEKDYAVFLCKNNEGYSELCKIITSRKLLENFSLRDLLQKEFPNHFILISSLKLLKEVPAYSNIYAELILSKNQKKQTRKLYEYCRENLLGYVVSNPVYFPEEMDYQLHKIVTAIKLNENFASIPKENLVDEEYYFKDPAEAKWECRNLPTALKNIEFIEQNCNVDLKLNEYKFPKFQLPEGYQSAYEMLYEKCIEGLKQRYGGYKEKPLKRLEYELSVIEELNFSNYFLIVWDIVNEAQRRGMLFIGRGSAANSIVSYVLGLTQVDPIEHNLYFERFLNKGRSSPPDIDIDFSWKERDDIIKYVFDKYGYQNVAMISTHITFRARSAFREVAKTFGITDEEISKYSKHIPWADARNLEVLSEKYPEARSVNFKIEPWLTITKLAAKIANFPRHLSIHPSGIIVTPQPVNNFVALEYAKNKGLGLIVTQPDMYSVEDMGLIKIDILSQRSLGVLRDTITMIAENLGDNG